MRYPVLAAEERLRRPREYAVTVYPWLASAAQNWLVSSLGRSPSTQRESAQASFSCTIAICTVPPLLIATWLFVLGAEFTRRSSAQTGPRCFLRLADSRGSLVTVFRVSSRAKELIAAERPRQGHYARRSRGAVIQPAGSADGHHRRSGRPGSRGPHSPPHNEPPGAGVSGADMKQGRGRGGRAPVLPP